MAFGSWITRGNARARVTDLTSVKLERHRSFAQFTERAICERPRALPRVIQLRKPSPPGPGFVLLTSILQAFVQALFQGMTVRGSYPFRVTRNSDFSWTRRRSRILRTGPRRRALARHFGDSGAARSRGQHAGGARAVLLSSPAHRSESVPVDGPVNLGAPDAGPPIWSISRAQSLPRSSGASEAAGSESRPCSESSGKAMCCCTIRSKSFDPVIDFPGSSPSTTHRRRDQADRYPHGTDSVLMKY